MLVGCQVRGLLQVVEDLNEGLNGIIYIIGRQGFWQVIRVLQFLQKLRQGLMVIHSKWPIVEIRRPRYDWCRSRRHRLFLVQVIQLLVGGRRGPPILWHGLYIIYLRVVRRDASGIDKGRFREMLARGMRSVRWSCSSCIELCGRTRWRIIGSGF